MAEHTTEQTWVEDPVLKQRYRFRRKTGDDGAEVLEIDTWVEPGGGVTPHVHPGMEERFHVLSGTPSFLSGRRWRQAAPGETVVVPRGVRHAYRNTGTEVAHVVCDATPPSSLQAFLEEVGELAQDGAFLRPGVPRPSALLRSAAMVERHRDMVTLGFPLPPRFVQRLLFPPLARLAARRD